MCKFILQLEREPLETVAKKIALNKFLHFMEATNKGFIFRVTYIIKRWSFFGFIELHCHVLGKSFFDEVASQMVFKLTYLATIMFSKSCTAV